MDEKDSLIWVGRILVENGMEESEFILLLCFYNVFDQAF